MEAVQDYEALKASLLDAANEHGEPHWLADRRVAAVDAMVDLPLPEVRRFDYHRWPLTPIGPLQWQRSDKALVAGIAIDDAHIQFVQVGQTTVAVNLPDELDEAGVILTDIFSAFREHPRLTEKHFMDQIINANEDQLTAHHVAFLNGGLFLYVPKNVVIDKPIEAYFVQDSTQKAPMVSHVLIIAEEGAEFSFTQHLTTAGDESNAASCVAEILARPNSHVRFSSLDELGDQTTAYLNRRARIGKNATIDWAIGVLNGGNTVADFDSDLQGEGSHADAKVITVTTGKQKNGINTRVTNRGKHSVGHILQRGVLLEKSELVFNGIGDIIHGASGANAEQENRVLMLSDKAHGDANPILLIDENDVIAGHAASVGQIDQNQMYYLMSRGIDKAKAQRLVIRGFLGAVLSAVPSKTVRQELTDVIERKLEDGQKFK
ncbi:Fe-S cluster assembly protein SufD [uncultured Secundilactobacillus sp.]|uniref:Fe-S cluster assembly protein SufD n=1 Tax=uncultured Secundilactobacillus sp. TaxID=2813935 RepID=UPI00258A9CED|nr:Fe-S cluster assembly protein SufD [uncultured Secundilactobacillus sp.]